MQVFIGHRRMGHGSRGARTFSFLAMARKYAAEKGAWGPFLSSVSVLKLLAAAKGAEAARAWNVNVR
jgi:hypothetical protein